MGDRYGPFLDKPDYTFLGECRLVPFACFEYGVWVSDF